VLFEHVETITPARRFPLWERCVVLRLQKKLQKLLLSPIVWNSDRELPSAILSERTIDRSRVTLPIQHNQVPDSRTRRRSRLPRVGRLKIKFCLTVILFAEC
jgi:hypothetical protein